MFLILIKKLIAKKRLINFNPINVNQAVDSFKVANIGILNSNFSKDSNQVLLNELIDLMPIDAKIHTLTFFDNAKEISHVDSSFSHQSFNLFCNITDDHLVNFLSQDFDLLINFYPSNQPFLELASHLSKSKFKVGLSAKNLVFNSFVIETDVNQPNEFALELKKYLKLMHKI
jgi:hypothetical protein